MVAANKVKQLKKLQRGSNGGMRIYEELGAGSFGKVYRAFDPSQNQVVAIKMIEMDTSGDIDEALLELRILSDMRNNHITRYFNSTLYDSILCVSMEYCAAGSCASILKQFTVFREDSCAYVLSGVLKGLEYIHDQQKIHRDLKSANILVTHGCVVKIADFGVSAQLSGTTPERRSFMGTPYWMAPEVIGSNLYGTAVDIWSLGIVAFELITGEPPYRDLRPTQAMMYIVEDEAPRIPSIVRNTAISSAFVKLVASCLTKDPQFRPSARALLSTAYMKAHRTVPHEFRVMVDYMLNLRRNHQQSQRPRTVEDIKSLAPEKSKRSRPVEPVQSNSDVEYMTDSFDLSADNMSDYMSSASPPQVEDVSIPDRSPLRPSYRQYSDASPGCEGSQPCPPSPSRPSNRLSQAPSQPPKPPSPRSPPKADKHCNRSASSASPALPEEPRLRRSSKLLSNIMKRKSSPESPLADALREVSATDLNAPIPGPRPLRQASKAPVAAATAAPSPAKVKQSRRSVTAAELATAEKELSAQGLMKRAFSQLKDRTKPPEAIARIDELAANIQVLNSAFPGFTRAYLQEIWRAIEVNEEAKRRLNDPVY